MNVKGAKAAESIICGGANCVADGMSVDAVYLETPYPLSRSLISSGQQLRGQAFTL